MFVEVIAVNNQMVTKRLLEPKIELVTPAGFQRKITGVSQNSIT